jgi:hypothetical protein
MSALRSIGLAILCAFAWAAVARPGTTGVLRGCVTDETTHRPIAGALVIAESAAEKAEARTDALGDYVFVDLIPGTYTLSVRAAGFEPVWVAQIPVQADVSRTVALTTHRRLMVVIDSFIYHPRSWLVRPGITSDVYSVYTPANGEASIPARTPFDFLRFVPGVQAAQGQQVPHE